MIICFHCGCLFFNTYFTILYGIQCCCCLKQMFGHINFKYKFKIDSRYEKNIITYFLNYNNNNMLSKNSQVGPENIDCI